MAGTPVGPAQTSALRRVEVLRALVRADLRDRHDLTATGFLKWVLEPLVYTAMYFLLIEVVLQRGQPDYALFLLCALVPWRYVQGVTGGGLGMLRSYSNIISTRVLPRRTLPLVALVSEGLSLLLALLVLVPMMLVQGAGVTPALLWLPVVLLVLALLLAGPAYLAAVFGLYFPDFQATAQSVLRVGLLLSTALVAGNDVPGDLLPWIIQANPVSGIFDSMRAVIVSGDAPGVWDLVYPALVGAGLLAIGLTVYGAREPEFAKEV